MLSCQLEAEHPLEKNWKQVGAKLLPTWPYSA
jgi:hypothetical protein